MFTDKTEPVRNDRSIAAIPLHPITRDVACAEMRLVSHLRHLGLFDRPERFSGQARAFPGRIINSSKGQ